MEHEGKNKKRNVTASSFGAGVQSTAILLLIKYEPQRILDAMGEIPEVAVFADTGAEVQAVYQHLKWVRENTPIEFLEVNNGNILGTDRGHGNRSFVPMFTKNKDGSVSMLKRKCTSEFKITPIQRALRHRAGLKKGQRGDRHQIRLWLGISTDEAGRMTTNRSPTFLNQYPLIELGLSRQDCYAINQKYGIDAPKSRCFMCPFTRDWGDVKRNQPEDWARAVEFDRQIRDITNRGNKGIKNPTFLHRSCLPLDEAIHDQGHLWEGFMNECQGYCGT